MTGCGFKEAAALGARISAEIRSVNSRFLDINISLPPALAKTEPRARELLRSRFARGKIDASIRLEGGPSSVSVSANVDAAISFRDAIAQVAAALGIEGGVPLSLVIEREGVLESRDGTDASLLWPGIEEALSGAADALKADREREGLALKRDISKKLDTLDSCAVVFEKWQTEMEGAFMAQTLARFKSLLGDGFDEARAMQETAAQLVRSTINEEVVRLKSHLAALRALLESDGPSGKRMDFVCQEANREINTIGSKNQCVEVGGAVVDAKEAIEDIREQIRNVE